MADVQKLKEERAALQMELDLRQKAINPSEAAGHIADTIAAGKVDPILNPDNEWTGTGGKPSGDGCCIVM